MRRIDCGVISLGVARCGAVDIGLVGKADAHNHIGKLFCQVPSLRVELNAFNNGLQTVGAGGFEPLAERDVLLWAVFKSMKRVRAESLHPSHLRWRLLVDANHNL